MIIDRIRGLLARYRFLSAQAQNEEEEEQKTVNRGKDAASPISQIVPRQKVQVIGIVQAVTYTPAQTSRVFRVSLSDGTGTVLLTWFARKQIPGIYPGVRILASGVATLFDGAISIPNPRYDLLPAATKG